MPEKKEFFTLQQDMLEKKYFFVITESRHAKSNNKQTPLSPNRGMVMEIEKVKEIKKALEDHSIEKLKYQDGIKIKEIDFISILTLINELESENNELKNIIAKE